MKLLPWCFAGALLIGAAVPAAADAPPAVEVLQTRCGACHARLQGGGLSRISEQRKTPEGWLMTIARMEQLRPLQVSDEERRALVKHLSDTQGLAPAETRGFRYALERRPDVIESPPDQELGVVCGRCHSYAQLALQRRDAAEWLKLSHFHLGEWPTTEYQSRGRDIDWWEIATTRAPVRLAELYPLSTTAWSEWRQRAQPDLSGSWRVVGHRPGHGAYQGRMSVTRTAPDEYAVALEIAYAGGKKVSGEGKANVYTGYEWRASVDLGGESVAQVLALSEDGQELSGRWFLADSDSLGADLRAVRGGESRILAVDPPYLRAGERSEVAIHGVGLSGEVSLGDGVEIAAREAGADTVRVLARAASKTDAGEREVAVGGARASGRFAVYQRIDAVRVEPAYAIARVGGGGGRQAAVPVQFDAVAYLAGPDGKPGTDDDVRLGAMKARWSVADFDATAAQLKDAKFAGKMQPGGLFLPAEAGPNPKRPYHTNNAGDLRVHAAVSDGKRTVEGTAHLIVSMQRWKTPPIR